MAILMPRPIGRKGKPVRLYMNPEIRRRGDKLAFTRDTSLSALVETLLDKATKRAGIR